MMIGRRWHCQCHAKGLVSQNGSYACDFQEVDDAPQVLADDHVLYPCLNLPHDLVDAVGDVGDVVVVAAASLTVSRRQSFVERSRSSLEYQPESFDATEEGPFSLFVWHLLRVVNLRSQGDDVPDLLYYSGRAVGEQ